MRVAVVTLFYTLALITFGGPGVGAGDQADVEKELMRFQK
jgi:hypothetical protein